METPTPQAVISRDNRGRFERGHAGGPGRPPRVVEDRYREALQAACTPEELQAIVARVVKAALEGDLAAAKLVLDRMVPVDRTPLPVAIPAPAAVTVLRVCEETIQAKKDALRAAIAR